MSAVTEAQAAAARSAQPTQPHESTQPAEPAEQTKPTVRRDVARNRAKLLAAADELVADRGLDMSLNELARRAGVGVGTVYRHFADREAVIDALFLERLELIAGVLDEALAMPDPGAALRWAFMTLGERMVGDRALVQIMTTNKSETRRDAVRAMLLPRVTPLVQRAQASGQFRPEMSPLDLSMTLLMMHTVTLYSGAVRPELWRRYLQILLDGYAAPDQPRDADLVRAMSPDEMAAAMAALGEANGGPVASLTALRPGGRSSGARAASGAGAGG
jgi:AcrR family transcriptional regulator